MRESRSETRTVRKQGNNKANGTFGTKVNGLSNYCIETNLTYAADKQSSILSNDFFRKFRHRNITKYLSGIDRSKAACLALLMSLRRLLYSSDEGFIHSESKTFLLADVQNVLAEHEMFDKFGGGETSKQGQAIETISCQTKDVGQFRQALRFLHRAVQGLKL